MVMLCNCGLSLGLEPTLSLLPRKIQSYAASNSWVTETQLAQMKEKEVLCPTPDSPMAPATGPNDLRSLESTEGGKSLLSLKEGIDLPIVTKGGLGVGVIILWWGCCQKRRGLRQRLVRSPTLGRPLSTGHWALGPGPGCDQEEGSRTQQAGGVNEELMGIHSLPPWSYSSFTKLLG